MFAELTRHDIERLGQLLEFITAGQGYLAGEILCGDLPGTLLQLTERGESPANQEQGDKEDQPEAEENGQKQVPLKILQRLQQILLGLTQDNGPGAGAESRFEKQVPSSGIIAPTVMTVFELPLILPAIQRKLRQTSAGSGIGADQCRAALIVHRQFGRRRQQRNRSNSPQIRNLHLGHQIARQFPAHVHRQRQIDRCRAGFAVNGVNLQLIGARRHRRYHLLIERQSVTIEEDLPLSGGCQQYDGVE